MNSWSRLLPADGSSTSHANQGAASSAQHRADGPPARGYGLAGSARALHCLGTSCSIHPQETDKTNSNYIPKARQIQNVTHCVCVQESGYYISKWPLAKTYFFTFFQLHGLHVWFQQFMPPSVCAGYFLYVPQCLLQSKSLENHILKK